MVRRLLLAGMEVEKTGYNGLHNRDIDEKECAPVDAQRDQVLRSFGREDLLCHTG